MINIEEVENDGYFTTSGGLVIKYMASYLIAHHAAIDEFRYPATEKQTSFRNTKTDKLTISIYDKDGATSASHITSD